MGVLRRSDLVGVSQSNPGRIAEDLQYYRGPDLRDDSCWDGRDVHNIWLID